MRTFRGRREMSRLVNRLMRGYARKQEERERERERGGEIAEEREEEQSAITSSEWRRPRGAGVISGNGNFQAN